MKRNTLSIIAIIFEPIRHRFIPYFPPVYERRCSRTRAHTHIHRHTRTHARTWPCGRNLLHNDSLKLGPVYVPFVAGSLDACKGATIDWYSFRGRLYPRTFSRSFVTGAGIEMCRLFGRRVMHSTHSPLPPLFLHSSRPRAPRKHFRRLFLSTRAMKERAFSLSLPLYLSLCSNRGYRKQTRLFSNVPNLNSSPRSDLVASSSSSSRWRVLPSVRDLKCVFSRCVSFSRFRKWLLGEEERGWVFVLKSTRSRGNENRS